MGFGSVTRFVVLAVMLVLALVPSPARAQTEGWSQPTLLDTWIGYGPAQVDVAMNDVGEAVAAWSFMKCPLTCWPVDSIRTSRFVPGVGWGVASSHSSGGGRFGDEPQVAMNSDGRAVVVWEESEGDRYLGNRTNYISTYISTPVGDSRPEVLAWWRDDNRSYRWPIPQLQMDGAGNALAVWQQWDGARDRIFASRFTWAAGWQPPSPVDAGAGYAILPRLAMDRTGSAAVAWIEFAGVVEPTDWYPWYAGTFAVHVRRFMADAGGWGPDETIAGWTAATNKPAEFFYGTAGQLGQPLDLAINGAGDLAVTWNDHPSPGVHVSLYAPDTRWTTPLLLGEGGYDRIFPRVAMDSGGNVSAVWTGDGTSADPVFVARFDRVAGRFEEARLGDGTYPQIAYDTAGNALATWWSPTGVMVSRFSPESGWGTARLVAKFRIAGLAVNSHGAALVVGYDRSSSNYTSWTSFLWASFGSDPFPPALTLVQPIDGATTMDSIIFASGTTEPGATVSVNGIIADVRANGSFGVLVRLAEGMNQITVEARDRDGHVATASVSVTYVDPVQGLENRLTDLEGRLTNTSDALTGTKNSLDAANASIASLTLLVVVLFAALIAVMALPAARRLVPWVRRWGDSESEQAEDIPRPVETVSATSPAPPPPRERPSATALPPERAFRLTTKERILLHLHWYRRNEDASERPQETTQEGIATAAWVEQRHLGQYLEPLIRDGLVQVRSAHVQNGRQRRRVYELTPAGSRVALRLEHRAKSEVVQVWDGEHTWDVRVGEILEKVRGKIGVLDILRQVAQEGVIDFSALTPASDTSASNNEEHEESGHEE